MMKKSHFAPVNPKVAFPSVEHEMLKFWNEEHIFEKSVEARKNKPKFVFFDGPPFANGLPHYGHILANALKDAVTRYATMKGFYVPRTNGWDCHGLPVEYGIEKELKISGRKDIEKMGVAKFNTECRKSVFRYTEEWEKLLNRIGRWVDFEHSYATLENNYMESIWWVFKEIWKKKLVYEGHKSMHICPRCETPLSNFEVTLGYKDVADPSVIWKFPFVEEPNTSLLAWTTTPWSTPGTMGLSIGPDFDYVKVRTGDEFLIFAKARISFVMKGVEDFEIVEEMKGSSLVGKKYVPVLDDFKNHPSVKNNKNVYHTFAGDYVDISAGTGIVTINGAYGEIDMEVAEKNGLPILFDVNTDGRFNESLQSYKGMYVKEGEKKLIEDMKKVGRVWRTEPYLHSYPHCWRCDTPLLNYATQAWFIRVTDVKEKLLKNNKRIRWVPDHIQEGRFGKWLDGARDWNISRNRFWGCPIPVWKCVCGNAECIGSVKELREKSLGGNTYFFIRHGEAEQNEKGILNSDPRNIYHLTKKGREQAEKMAQALKKEGIDMIFASPLARTKETAEILSAATGIPVEFSQHLREHGVGVFEGKSDKEFLAEFPNLDLRWTKRVSGGESFQDVFERTSLFLDFLGRKYSGKRIAIVTHGNVIRGAWLALGEKPLPEIFQTLPDFAAPVRLYAGRLPKREANLDLHKPYIDEIQLECSKCKKPMKRIPEVLDCWFESGAMPYAQLHYPFENKKEFEDNFPANFIAEGLDQTRGWFYTLHVLSTLLFNTPAFQNVIVNGILLAADGEKLSKRKKNYPDPNKLFETHGVDAMRFFLYTSTAPLAEDVRFSEKHVEEMVKQFLLPLWNTYSFFVTYANIDGWHARSIEREAPFINKLDEWILSELHALIGEVTKNMDTYNFTKATRPMLEFVDNLSNWYVRRSRRRFWKSESDEDKASAYQTLYTVLIEFSKLLAPFMPFIADAMYKNLTGNTSVHMEDWPAADKKLIQPKLNEEVYTIRTIVSLALRIRAKKNIKVRQPLAKLLLALPKRVPQTGRAAARLPNYRAQGAQPSSFILEYKEILLEELNVKDIEFVEESGIATQALTVDSRKIGPRFGADTQKILALSKAGKFELMKDGSVQIGNWKLEIGEFSLGYKGKEGFDVESSEGILVGLDTKITPELLQEGYARDIIRFIQELRKKAGYGLADRITIFVKGEKSVKEAVTCFADQIKRETLALELQESGDFEGDMEAEVEVDGMKVKVGVRRSKIVVSNMENRNRK